MLIQRYVAGSATSEEKEKLKKWMEQSSENRRLVQDVKNIWDNTPTENFEVNVEEAWKYFEKRRMKKKQFAQHPRKPQKTLIYFYRVAAVLLVSLFASYVLYTQIQFESEQSQQHEQLVTMQELATGVGDKAEVTFSDGSRVILNASSKIEFPQKFQSQKREVFLEGEAYFEVKHDSKRPFLVHNKNVEVEVLGTKFNVRGWYDDPDVEVVVQTGKVAVKVIDNTILDQKEAILTDGNYTKVKSGISPLSVQKVDVREHLVWMSGGLFFDNEPLKYVVKDIERRFDVNIKIVNEEYMDIPFTSTFYEADLNEVLSIISSTMKLNYERNGKYIEFYKSE